MDSSTTTTWFHYGAVFLLFALLTFASTWQLAASPATWFDEGINLGIVDSTLHHGVYSLETAPGEFVAERQFLITTNYPVLVPVALSVIYFGHTLPAARAPMAIFLILFALTAYFVV